MGGRRVGVNYSPFSLKVIYFIDTNRVGIKKWTEKLNLSSKKFLIPLSYATILGGMCTLIGTSTNLVVHGLILENVGIPT